MRQVLINLLSNAVKFTPRHGNVGIEASLEPDGALSITVSDTGIGMTEEQIASARQPFRQVDSSLARKYEGTGLGLPLAEGFMHLHGGRLQIISTINVGTRVIATFPAERTEASSPMRAAADVKRGKAAGRETYGADVAPVCRTQRDRNALSLLKILLALTTFAAPGLRRRMPTHSEIFPKSPVHVGGLSYARVISVRAQHGCSAPSSESAAEFKPWPVGQGSQGFLPMPGDLWSRSR